MQFGAADDRRRRDRRSEDVRLADFSVPRFRKAVVTAVVLAGVLALLAYMLHEMLVAMIAGVVLGAYLIPLCHWLQRRLRNVQLAAIVTITGFTVPLIAIIVYSWVEVTDAAVYLEANREAITRRLTVALQRLPFTEGIAVQDDLSRAVDAASQRTSVVVEDMQEALDLLVLSIAVFLFTVFYVLTDHRRILDYLRRKVRGRYKELIEQVSRSVEAVVYGALYATFLTQIMKATVVLVLNLIWDVPLALLLSIAAFFLGFFPIIGSWVVYVPVSIYAIVFRGDTVGGMVILAVGFLVNTLFLSMYLRPKIAAERSHVLNFYWMFIALLTGVYTFGLVGIIIGPVLLAVLKAVFDTITGGAGPPVGRSPAAEPGA